MVNGKDIKAVMCDVDGTILGNSWKLMTENDSQSNQKVKEKGILFGLCTGRDVRV